MCHSISTCSTQAMIRQCSLFLFSTSHGSLQRFMAIITVLHSCAEGPHAPSIKAMYHSAQANSKNVRRLKAIYIRPGRCIDGTSDAQKWVKTFRNAAGNTCSAADGHFVGIVKGLRNPDRIFLTRTRHSLPGGGNWPARGIFRKVTQRQGLGRAAYPNGWAGDGL